MQNKAIRSAYQRIQPTQADKERMLRNILAAAPQVKKAPGDRPRYQKVYEPPKRSSILGPIAAVLVFALLGGGLLGWFRANRVSSPSLTQPSESQTVQTTDATEAEITQADLTLYARALWEHPEFSSEIMSYVQGQPESTSTHHVYTFYDWNLDGKQELLIGLWDGNYAYRGSNESVTHEVRLENSQVVVYPFTGNERMAYLCQGGVWEDVSFQGCQLLPVGGGNPVLRVFYDESLDSWYKMSDDPNSPYDIPIEEEEKDQLLEAYPHLKLDWQHIMDFPGLRELADQGPTALCDIHRELEALETQYQRVKQQVDHDASRSIDERTELAGQLFQLWDDALNELWATLRGRLDGQAMEALLESQRAWLRDRDTRVQEETANFAGGDIFDMVVNEKNAELTRVRVYTLVADYLCDQCPIPAPEGDSSDDGQAASPYDEELSGLEEVWADLNEQLQYDGSLTQADMNELSSHLHTLWDDALNRILEDLKADLEGDALTALMEEQQRWVNAKDAEVQAAMAPYAGGTISGMISGDKAAELTRDRVYELVDRYFR